MKVNLSYATNEILVRLTQDEATRIAAFILDQLHTCTDPDGDPASNLEDSLREILT
jgi:hypothetical protein